MKTTTSTLRFPNITFTFNGIVDLPVGKGKRFLHNSNRFVDALLGRLPGGIRRAGGVAVVPGGRGELGTARARFRSTAVPCRSTIAAAAYAIPSIFGSTGTSRRP